MNRRIPLTVWINLPTDAHQALNQIAAMEDIINALYDALYDTRNAEVERLSLEARRRFCLEDFDDPIPF